MKFAKKPTRLFEISRRLGATCTHVGCAPRSDQRTLNGGDCAHCMEPASSHFSSRTSKSFKPPPEALPVACTDISVGIEEKRCFSQDGLDTSLEPGSKVDPKIPDDSDCESCPEHYIAFEGVAAGDANKSVEDSVSKEQIPSPSTTCSSGTGNGRSGSSMATGDGDVSITAVCITPVEACSFYEGCDHAAVASEGNSDCSVGTALKRQALLAAIGIHSTSQAKIRHPLSRGRTVLHFAALVLSFVMLVSLWGIMDAAVELLAGSSCTAQLKWYSLLLAAGSFMTLILKLSQRRGYACTVYPALLASLAMIVPAWGIIDGLVELAAGGSKHSGFFYYFLVFVVAALLVFLHTYFYDRSFSTQLRRFVCY